MPLPAHRKDRARQEGANQPGGGKVALTLDKTEGLYLNRAVERAGRGAENLHGLRDDPFLAAQG